MAKKKLELYNIFGGAFLILLLSAELFSSTSDQQADGAKERSLTRLRELNAELSFNKNGSLKGIDISEQNVVDNDMPNLSFFVELREFHGIYTQLNGRFLSNLKKCEKLEVLDLYAAPIEDVELIKFKDAKNLKIVNLAGTKISDKSIKIIESWKKLEQLEVGSSKITTAGIEKLHKILPNVNIVP